MSIFAPRPSSAIGASTSKEIGPCTTPEGNDETNNSLHTNVAHIVHSGAGMRDTAQSGTV
jgi:hypothetical protein